ncbi:hypothetical protein [Paenibacillus pinihumi]|uniref:hypothetical protein n=1 Tax=Paenibacillus pinihumi TaxID=669462 RepID=UPI0003FB467A|nr:hypothetical protein [Paenibacillus pinihumi]
MNRLLAASFILTMLFVGGCQSKAVLNDMEKPVIQPARHFEDYKQTEAVISEATRGEFTLQVMSAKKAYRPGEEVELEARLKYAGNEEAVLIEHAASPFTFLIQEQTRAIGLGYEMDQPLIRTVLKQGQWTSERYAKQTVIIRPSPEQEAFIKEFLEQEGFPEGSYAVKVEADFNISGQEELQNDRYRISAEIAFEVRGEKE